MQLGHLLTAHLQEQSGEMVCTLMSLFSLSLWTSLSQNQEDSGLHQIQKNKQQSASSNPENCFTILFFDSRDKACTQEIVGARGRNVENFSEVTISSAQHL